MKKQVLSLVLAVMMLVSLVPMSVFAEAETSGTYTDDNDITYTLENGILTVSGEGVCSAVWQEHFDRDFVTEAVVESGITSIGYAAFFYCTELSSITIPDGVTSIDGYAFDHCISLKSIKLPDSLTYIDWHAFSVCSSLESVNIPDNVMSIESSAFLGCSSLESVNIPGKVTSIGDGVFNACRSLKDITISDSVTSIGESAFVGTAYYTDEANWDGGVLYIGNYLIEAKDKLSGEYTVRDGTKAIAEYAFCNSSSLKSVVIPDSITSIDDYVFYRCSSLKSIDIGNSVTEIGEWAFYRCYSLKSISIPKSVTSIGDNAFSYCASLTDIYYAGTQEQWNAIIIGDGNTGISNSTIYCDNEQPRPHTHSYTETVTAPTCTEKGYTIHVCDCGDIYVNDFIAALGHEYKDGVCKYCREKDPDYKDPYHPEQFADVPDSAYYAWPVTWAVICGITDGYSDNTFRPMTICTRAQIVTFIWRAHNCPEPTGTEQGFNDVVEGAYYYKAVLWAAEQGITGGFDDGGFHPDETVTRAQAMTFLWRAEGCHKVQKGTVNTFSDVPEDAYYRDAVLWAVETGVTGGYTGITFGPMDGCTRAQIVTFLYRNAQVADNS